MIWAVSKKTSDRFQNDMDRFLEDLGCSQDDFQDDLGRFQDDDWCRGWAGGMRLGVSAAPGLPGLACQIVCQVLPGSRPALVALCQSSCPGSVSPGLIL